MELLNVIREELKEGHVSNKGVSHIVERVKEVIFDDKIKKEKPYRKFKGFGITIPFSRAVFFYISLVTNIFLDQLRRN